jgi:hypothetical protein
MKTSTQNLILIHRKPQLKLKQQIRTRGNWIIRGNKQKCLACKGIPKIILGGNGKLAGFYSVGVPYPHKEFCTNRR